MENEVITPLTFNNLSAQELVQEALKREEGTLSQDGALVVKTGKRTGRSPKDRFIVRDELTANTVDWGKVNQPMDPAVFSRLWNKGLEYLSDKTSYTSQLRVGADPDYFIPVQVITELAWHNLFAQHLFIRTEEDYCGGKTPWTILSVPGLKLNPKQDDTNSDGVVILNMSQHCILIAGILYAGEMKKAMFSVMNYLLPPRGVLPMHCSANVGEEGDDVALFFGLSGTGKTTLSADPDRYLVGDDEHGWSETGVFNFEGGCYAKCINLSQEREPLIWNALRDGTILENVIIDQKTKTPDYNDDRLTQNTRAAYPREYIEKRIESNRAGLPKTVIFLTCDLYGVLPPISLLTKEQAAYHFLSGYTAKVGSTEVGSTSAVMPEFSRCYGAPFFPRPASVYAELLMQHIDATNARVFLINTGWTGGPFGEGGERFSIPVTRSIVNAALNGDIDHHALNVFPGFGLKIPATVNGVDTHLLNPMNTWKNKNEFHKKLNQLIELFRNNFEQFDVAQAIIDAGPMPVTN